MLDRNALLLVSAATICALAGCDNPSGSTAKFEPAPAGAPSPVVTITNATVSSTSDPLAGVVNKDLVREPADQSRILPEKGARVASGFTAPLRSGPRGDQIGSLSPAALVTEVATDPSGDYYLVLYPDPGDRTKQLAGWVFKDAVENTGWTAQETATSPSPKVTLSCGKGETSLKSDHAFCATTCSDDSACARGGKGETCDGLAFEPRTGATRVEAVHYCVSTEPPATISSEQPSEIP